jgi:hypothetical protein
MSYDAAGTNGALTRGGQTTGAIQMGWFKVLTYGSFAVQMYTNGNGPDWAFFVGNGTTGTTDQIMAWEQSNISSVVESGSNTNWIFLCYVVNTGVNFDVYFRHEGDTSLTHLSLVDTGTDLGNQLQFFNENGTTTNTHQRMTAFKEWIHASDLTTTQIMAESTQNAPIVTTNVFAYLQCDAGHTIGVNQLGSGNNFTTTGTITTNADEPNMSVAGGTTIPTYHSYITA